VAVEVSLVAVFEQLPNLETQTNLAIDETEGRRQSLSAALAKFKSTRKTRLPCHPLFWEGNLKRPFALAPSPLENPTCRRCAPRCAFTVSAQVDILASSQKQAFPSKTLHNVLGRKGLSDVVSKVTRRRELARLNDCNLAKGPNSRRPARRSRKLHHWQRGFLLHLLLV